MQNPNLKDIKYSIIILIYHRTPELVEMAKDCLRSVIHNINRDECEIIIVDNGSTERTDFWEQNADTYVRLNGNYGISRGWNTGLRLAKGKYIAVLGDDVQVRQGWLGALQTAMDMPDCGIANVHVQHLPDYKGVIENYKWFSHACFMLTKNTIDKVGYYREDLYYPCNFEDNDYVTRVYKAGLKAYVNYAVSVQHLEGQTVHAPDLSVHFQRLKRVYFKEHGFDPTEVFYGNRDIHSVLQSSQ